MKKTLITLCLALGLGLMFGACQREVPNIKFENEITETSDFSGVLAAIKDQSKTLAEKLDLIKDAIYKTEGTLSEKLDLIEKAVDRGITTYKEMAQAMIA
ncbi:MAG: hypothetical protein HUJ92_08860, partial [Bacteroidales bacterium]|nr:hypothetical protein [Bacteroidales bacterium]